MTRQMSPAKSVQLRGTAMFNCAGGNGSGRACGTRVDAMRLPAMEFLLALLALGIAATLTAFAGIA